MLLIRHRRTTHGPHRSDSPRRAVTVAVPLRRDAARRVLDACPQTPAGLRDAALVSVMRVAMLRGVEAAALEWADIDILDGKGAVTIRRSKTDRDGRRRIAVSISPSCLDRLDAWRPHAPDTTVFGLSSRSIAYVLRRAGERAGVNGLSGHSCRRGAAQDMALAGESAERLMARGRWTRMATAQRYINEPPT